jgi:RNA polymerase sigma factor (sigma-70 family)
MAGFPPIAQSIVEAARSGERASLEALASTIRRRAYNLAVRFLWNTEDAEDAAQDIVVATLAALPRFRGASSFSTYAYAIAVRKLRGRGFSPMERAGLRFEAYLEDAPPPPEAPTLVGRVGAADRPLLELELKRSCTYGMLVCLDREDRLAYVLHAFFALRGEEAAAAMGVSHAAYRKRLSRVRSRMAAFMGEVCGLAGSPRCRCADRIDYAAALGRIDPRSPRFAERTGMEAPGAAELEACRESMEELDAASAVFRSDGALAGLSRSEAATALLAELRPAMLRSAFRPRGLPARVR